MRLVDASHQWDRDQICMGCGTRMNGDAGAFPCATPHKPPPRVMGPARVVTPKSRARDKSVEPDGIVRVTCEVSFEDGSMNAKAAGVLEDAIRKACGEAFPTKRVAGLWVHEKA